MDFVETIRAVAALGITLGLIGLAAYGARRWGPDWLTRLAPSRTDKRLAMVESLPLDASRRLVLVRLLLNWYVLDYGFGDAALLRRGMVGLGLLTRTPDGTGGMITFTLRIPLERFYDRLRLAKGPSFGMKATLISPFMYLAHYDLVTTPAGRAELAASGIDPDLLRLCIGTEPVEELLKLTEQISRDFPNSVFFASKLIFVHDNFFTRWLHNQTALAMQQRLHLQGMQMVILPMKVE